LPFPLPDTNRHDTAQIATDGGEGAEAGESLGAIGRRLDTIGGKNCGGEEEQAEFNGKATHIFFFDLLWENNKIK
jgi:hypothetical protein